MSDQSILREYLVALGFRVDEHGSRDFDNRLVNLDKRALTLGKALVGVGAAAVTLTTVFARSMERMYYAARYGDTTVGKLQEMEFAFRNVGLEGGAATAGIKRMAEAVRGNPGLGALLEKITGKPIRGRDMSDVMVDFVKATKQMPFYQAQRVGSLFGFSPEDLFNLQAGIDELEKAREARRQMAEEMGVDADRTAAVAHEYMNLWRGVTERAGIFGTALGDVLLPKTRELVKISEDLLTDWVRIVHEINSAGTTDFWQKIREGVTGHVEGGGVKLTEDAKKRLGDPMYDIDADHVDPDLGHVPRWKRVLKRIAPKQFGRRDTSDEAAVDAVTSDSPVRDMPEAERVRRQREALAAQAGRGTPQTAAAPGARPGSPDAGPAEAPEAPGAATPSPVTSGAARGRKLPPAPPSVRVGEPDRDGGVITEVFDPEDYLAGLERQYKLPPGILDRVWNQESSRGDPKHMTSPKGARGHFGFMPDTAKAYGVRGKEDDFRASAEASAHMWSDLLKQYHGDVRQAAAAYNWGSRNMRDMGLGRAPKETREYMDAVAGPAQQQPVSVEQNTTINVNGVSDPARAADSVVRRQREVQGDLVRNLGPKVR